MRIDEFKDKKITVMGLGTNRGGLGVSKWLKRHGAKVTVTDLRDERALAKPIAELEKEPGPHPVRYVLGRHLEKDLVTADIVVRNPAVPNGSPYLKAARKAGVRVESDLSIFFRYCPFPIVGVTGSKGKTTVTLLLAAMAKRAFGRAVVAGNFGRSPLDDLDGLLRRRKPLPVILEISSWGLESLKAVKKGPHIAVLTNVYREHLNRYRNFAAYAAAKELIFTWQGKGDIAVLPFDQDVTREMGERVVGERFWIADRPPADGQNGLFFRGSSAMVRRGGEATELFSKQDVKLVGTHAVRDALIAAGTAFLMGADPKPIRAALRDFDAIPHRLELVRSVGGVEWWNDSAATHPEAGIAGLEAVAGRKKGKGGKRIVLIAGGADKKLDFSAWARAVKRRCKAVILFDGTATPKMERELKKVGVLPHAVVKGMPPALYRARLLASKGDAVLLSPGAASFGLFMNEFDRGDRFRRGVRAMRD